METLLLLIGVFVGTIITRVLMDLRSCHGYFKVEQVDPEEEAYAINVRIPIGQDLTKKKYMFLEKETLK